MEVLALNIKSAPLEIFDDFNFERQISLLRNEILMGLQSRRTIISQTNLNFTKGCWNLRDSSIENMLRYENQLKSQ